MTIEELNEHKGYLEYEREDEEREDHKEGTEQYGENSGWYECCAWIQQFIERGDFDEDK